MILFLVVVVAFAKRSPLIAPTLSEQPQTVVNNIQSASNADELMKFKNLLDQGAITQEEYDKKKEELLN